MTTPNWTIGKRIVLGSISIVLVAVGLGVFALEELHIIRSEAIRITKDCLPGLYRAGQLAEKIQALGNLNSTLLLKDLMSPNEEAKSGFDQQIQDNLKLMASQSDAYEHSIVDPGEKDVFTGLAASWKLYHRTLEKILQLSHAGDAQQAMELKQGQLEPQLEQVLAGAHAEVEFNKTKGDAAGRGIQTGVSSAERGVAIGLGCVFLAASTISVLIIIGTTSILRRLARSLGMASAQLSASAGRVTATSQTLASGAGEQAASLEETSATIEQISGTAKRNAESVSHVKLFVAQTRSMADAGLADFQDMSNAMAAIKVSSDNSARIIKEIDEIALQTTLLALNAAIEAGRAGEAGLGFAVVAAEVRKLALRSAQAAKDTAERIDDSLRKCEHGEQISSQVIKNLTEIVGKVRKIDELVSQIATASQEQERGIAQVNAAVGQIDKITQNTATSADETANSAAEVKDQATALGSAVEELSSLVGGIGRSRPDPKTSSRNNARAVQERPALNHGRVQLQFR